MDVQELGDRLVVGFRPRREWVALPFLAFWLVGWTLGGILAWGQLLHVGPAGTAFLLVWLAGWIAGECLVLGAIIWQLSGRETLTVTTDSIEIRWRIGRLARIKRYETGAVHHVTAELVPHDEDEQPRKDFGLRVSCADDEVHVGEGLDEREAEHIASLVESRIRPRGWWADDVEVTRTDAPGITTLAAGHLQVAEPSHRTGWRVAAAAVGCVALVGTLIATLLGDRDQRPAPRAIPSASPPYAGRPPATGTPVPTRADFRDARAYAAAMTSFAIASSRTTVLGQPVCSGQVMWTHWACRVRARATDGPYAGRALTYACRSVGTGAVLCGPVLNGRL
jgi:hypothetical protein